ncbi:MAG: oxidative damage protection protein [Rhodocyclales bacterium]|nr:oxidative damage protection protein [Rhodocyclales bacterium]
MGRMVKCVKLGREAEGMDFPPIPGELGKRIFENVSKEAWQGWIKFQTMLINENRLSLADAKARKYLAEQMEKHFFGAGADQVQGYVAAETLISAGAEKARRGFFVPGLLVGRARREAVAADGGPAS